LHGKPARLGLAGETEVIYNYWKDGTGKEKRNEGSSKIQTTDEDMIVMTVHRV
jgi:hypothetical protein